MKRRTITLPDDLMELLVAEAQRRQTSVSGIIRTFIVQALRARSASDGPSSVHRNMERLTKSRP
jgi:hypothetical protein